MENETLITLTSDIVATYVSNTKVPADGIASLIGSVYGALAHAGHPAEEIVPQEPAVAIRASVRPSAITCLECGKKMKMLKRHLGNDHDLTPDAYRAKWNLAADYPLVAPEYAARRAEIAKKSGLGRKPGADRKPAGATKLRLFSRPAKETADVASLDDTNAAKAPEESAPQEA